MVLSPRLTKLLKWIGYPLFALFAFVVCLYMTFPYERVRGVIEDHVEATGEMLLSIGEVSSSPLLGLKLENVRLTLLPSRSGPLALPRTLGRPPIPGMATPPPAPPKPPKPKVIHLEELTINTGLLALIGGGIDIDFSLKGLGGEVDGSYEASKKAGWALSLELEGINLKQIPQVADAVGLPIRGSVSAKVDLSVPANRWSEANGLVEVECKGCAVGDGKAKLKIPGNPLLAMGVTLPRLRLGEFGGSVKVEKGTATFENFSAKSPDVEIHLEGSVSMREPVAFSSLNGYLRFKLSPQLKQRDPKFELVENGLQSAKRSDGFFGVRIGGTLRTPRPFPSPIAPGRSSGPPPARRRGNPSRLR